MNADPHPSQRVAELTAILGSEPLGDFWSALVRESDETLRELIEFLRVPCADEGTERRCQDGIVSIEREQIGRLVRYEWIKWATEQPAPKPSWLVPWEQMAEADREADRRIGYACILQERRSPR